MTQLYSRNKTSFTLMKKYQKKNPRKLKIGGKTANDFEYPSKIHSPQP